MSGIIINDIFKEFGMLPLEDKEFAVEILEKQLIEAKRESIAKRAKNAMANLKKGRIKKGTIKDFYKDMEGIGISPKKTSMVSWNKER